MQTTGKLMSNISRDWQSGKLCLTFRIDTASEEEINDLLKMDKVSIDVKKYRKKRSLDANAYFHLLVGKLAEKMSQETPISFARVKNIMITSYGQPFLLESGVPVVIKTNVPVEQMMELETTHCKPCDVRIENGQDIVFYRVYRGSHTYDTAEMSRLIDGTVRECKDQGIDTLTPDEIRRMCAAWDTSTKKD